MRRISIGSNFDLTFIQLENIKNINLDKERPNCIEVKRIFGTVLYKCFSSNDEAKKEVEKVQKELNK